MSHDPGLNMEQTVNLLEEFREIERLANRARQALANGSAVSGTSALAKIENRANDARRWGDVLLVRREVMR